MAQERPIDVVDRLEVIHILDEEHYRDCHIKGSVNVPLSRVEAFARALPKEVEVVVYGTHYSCTLSREAWFLFRQLGFENVKLYEGGIQDWFDKGYPVEGPCKNVQSKQPSANSTRRDTTIKTISAQDLLHLMQKNNLL